MLHLEHYCLSEMLARKEIFAIGIHSAWYLQAICIRKLLFLKL